MSIDGLPAATGPAPGLVYCVATAQPEEPLAQQKVEDDSQVDDEQEQFQVVTEVTNSSTSSGTKRVVATNVRYSAHRLASHSPTISTASSVA